MLRGQPLASVRSWRFNACTQSGHRDSLSKLCCRPLVEPVFGQCSGEEIALEPRDARLEIGRPFTSCGRDDGIVSADAGTGLPRAVRWDNGLRPRRLPRTGRWRRLERVDLDLWPDRPPAPTDDLRALGRHWVQFADIARPTIGDQRVHRGRPESFPAITPEFGRRVPPEMPGTTTAAAPRAQGRVTTSNDSRIEQRWRETHGDRPCRQMLVRRGNDPVPPTRRGQSTIRSA